MAGSKDVVIIAGCRTPIGKFQGSLSDMTAPQIGAVAVREAVKRANLQPQQVDECIMGNVISAGIGQNPARQAALFGGLTSEVGALTINKVCGSGLKAVALAAQAIETGNSSIVVAGGMESMTNAPYLLPNARKGYRLGNGQLVDSMVHDGLWDIYNDYHMGLTGENVAEKYGITREEQDEFAVNSHRKAVAAQKECRFKAQIVPVEIPAKRKGQPATIFDKDEGPREDTTIEVLRSLKPAFKKDGTVTAGNAPGVNDGAAALVVLQGPLTGGCLAQIVVEAAAQDGGIAQRIELDRAFKEGLRRIQFGGGGKVANPICPGGADFGSYIDDHHRAKAIAVACRIGDRIKTAHRLPNYNRAL